MKARLAKILGLYHPMDAWCLGVLSAYPILITYHWQRGPNYLLSALTCIYAYTLGCIQHCHGHRPFFRSHLRNRALEFCFTLFRGDGCYAWKATHNANHHRFANHPGDYTLTYRYSTQNNPVHFFQYLLHAAYAYIRASGAYLIKLLFQSTHPRQRRLGYYWLLQLGIYMGLMLMLCLRDFSSTVFAVLIPQAFGIIAMIGTGYFQHNHTDENHAFNNSRNFTGFWLNLLTFNHGYHLVHHRHINAHWSEWPQAHAQVEKHIAPELNQKSLTRYFLKIFLLQYLHPSYRSRDFHSQSATT